MSDLKKFWLSLCLIIAGSVALQVFVFSKRFTRTQHYQPTFPVTVAPGDTFVPQGPPVEGQVCALSPDRFYLECQGKKMPFYYPTEGRPQLNARVRVYYYQGSPPAAVKVETLSK